jgi:hypothetical protein
MRTIVGLLLAVLVCLAGIRGDAQHSPGLDQYPAATYNNFMKLTAEQRRVRFSSLDNDTKAFLVRSHAREWLSRNQAKLSKSEVALFEEAISMVRSETYDRPSDPQLAELEAKLVVGVKWW